MRSRPPPFYVRSLVCWFTPWGVHQATSTNPRRGAPTQHSRHPRLIKSDPCPALARVGLNESGRRGCRRWGGFGCGRGAGRAPPGLCTIGGLDLRAEARSTAMTSARSWCFCGKSLLTSLRSWVLSDSSWVCRLLGLVVAVARQGFAAVQWCGGSRPAQSGAASWRSELGSRPQHSRRSRPASTRPRAEPRAGGCRGRFAPFPGRADGRGPCACRSSPGAFSGSGGSGLSASGEMPHSLRIPRRFPRPSTLKSLLRG
ncbi:hypothetical protein ACI1US_02605 [Leucobacter sp. BZR 635]